MNLKLNDEIGDANVFIMTESGPKSVSLKNLLSNKKALIIAVPGAFTPTCNDDHLPGFIKNYENFKNIGIDQIFFISVNDPFVVNKWKEYNKANNIEFLADSNLEFADMTGLKIDLSVIGLGVRLSRFALLIDNCILKKIFDEEGGGLEKSKAENILPNL